MLFVPNYLSLTSGQFDDPRPIELLESVVLSLERVEIAFHLEIAQGTLIHPLDLLILRLKSKVDY